MQIRSLLRADAIIMHSSPLTAAACLDPSKTIGAITDCASISSNENAGIAKSPRIRDATIALALL